MSEWAIRHSDGSVLKDENGNDVSTKSLEYSGSWMGECFVTVPFKNAAPILFKIGDYLTYRGEQFEINYDPGKIKQSRRNEHGEAFVCGNVKFNAKQDELARTEFLDIVLSDNDVHYTALTKFLFYVSSLDDLLDRIQANLDEQWGRAAWKLYSRNKLRSLQRGCDVSAWNKTYGEGIDDNTIKSTSISADGLTCWSALALVSSQFNVNFITRGRNVFVGTAGVPTSIIFRYGKGKGLYQIEQNADSEQSITTRLRAYGNTKNLPNRYYATLNLQVFATPTERTYGDGNSLGAGYLLDLDFIRSNFFDKIEEYSTDDKPTYLVVARCGDYTVKATVYKDPASTKAAISCRFIEGEDFPDNNVNASIVDGFIKELDKGTRVYFLSGINKESFPSGHKDYATDNLPNNMAVGHLMLPGFPNKSLKEWWDEQDEGTKKRINPNGRQYHFSTDKYRPFVDSLNISDIGVRPNSVYFDQENLETGLVDIYPTIEEMEVGGVRIDEVESADQIEDNGVFKDGQTVPNFHIYLKSAIDFDINEQIRNSTESPAISMRDGMCGGREFEINSAKKQHDGRWMLTCKRVSDDSLNLFFPYNDYQIKAGDHFVLTGIPLPDSYVQAASIKLLKYALAFLDKNDYTRYVYIPKVDEVFMARQHDAAVNDGTGNTISIHDTIKEGDFMQFSDDDLHISGNVTIDQLNIKEMGDKIPSYEITLREDKSVGTIQKIQEKINSLESGNGGNGGNIGATASQTQRLIESHGQKHFLSKTHDDTASGVITFLKGIVAKAKSLFKGISNDGDIENTGDIVNHGDILNDGAMKTKDLLVLGKATFFELEILKAKAAGGLTIESPGTFHADDVEETSTGYVLYQIAEQEGKTLTQMIEAPDQLLCAEFNIGTGRYQGASNHYYWRRVLDAPTDYVQRTINGKECKCLSVTLSKTDRDMSSNDAPQVGDDLCVFGNRTNKDRQNVKVTSIYKSFDVGLKCPYTCQYQGVNDYDLSKHRMTYFAANGNQIVGKLHTTSDTGEIVYVPADKGAWVQGTEYGYYDRVTHNGSLWLCLAEPGHPTTEEPGTGDAWQMQVAKGEQGESETTLTILTDRGNIIRNGQGEVRMTAVVTRGGIDITDTFSPTDFSWERSSGNPEYDTEWNNRHKGVGNILTVSAQDIFKRAVFDCILLDN